MQCVHAQYTQLKIVRKSSPFATYVTVSKSESQGLQIWNLIMYAHVRRSFYLYAWLFLACNRIVLHSYVPKNLMSPDF